MVSVAYSEGETKAAKETVLASDGLKIVCEVSGKGDTALIFLHGWCGDHEYWKNQVDVFAPDYKVVTLDQAGHGESGKGRKAWNVADLAADVEAVVKKLGIKRAILIGHSMGGPVALMAAKRMPDTVIAVIGVDSLQNAEQKMDEENIKKFHAAMEADFKGTLRAGMSGLLGDKVDPELKKWIGTRAENQNQPMALGLMRDMMKLDSKAVLKDAKVPVRCINSGGGYQFYSPTNVDVNKKYADYKVVLINEVGHYPMLEKPDEFNKKLKEVLAEFAGKK
jgi:pimeloyl-ACP methyl ester carboxylesterase